MGNGFVTDPGQLKALATTLYRLKGDYEAVTVTSKAEGEALGSWDVESGAETVQTKWTRKKPELGQLLGQLSQGVFTAAREYGWTEEQARKDASDQPTGSNPGDSTSPDGGGSTSTGGGSASPGGGSASSGGGQTSPGGGSTFEPADDTGPGDETTPITPTDTDGDGPRDYQDAESDNDSIPDSVEGGMTTPGTTLPGTPPTPGDPTSPGDGTTPGDPTTPVDTDGDGTPDYRDTDSDDDGIPDAVERTGNPDASVNGSTPGGAAHPGGGTSTSGGTTYPTADYDSDGIGDSTEHGSGDPPPAPTDVAPSTPTGVIGADTAGGDLSGGGSVGPDPGAGTDTGTGADTAGSSIGGNGSVGGGGSAGGPVPDTAPSTPVDPAALTGGGSVGSGSGTVGVGGEATGGGVQTVSGGRDGLPVAAAVAPVGVLGAAGAAAWAVHRKKAQGAKDAVEDDEDDYL